MTLYEKIVALHPELTSDPINFVDFIQLQNDMNGKGDYIAKWNHPTIPRPTDEELSALEAK